MNQDTVEGIRSVVRHLLIGARKDRADLKNYIARTRPNFGDWYMGNLRGRAHLARSTARMLLRTIHGRYEKLSNANTFQKSI